MFRATLHSATDFTFSCNKLDVYIYMYNMYVHTVVQYVSRYVHIIMYIRATGIHLHGVLIKNKCIFNADK